MFCAEATESKPLKLETSRKVILHLAVSILCSHQCDQMARLLFKYLIIYNIKNMPNCISNLPNFCQIRNGPYNFGQSRLKFLLSGKIFAKSGHTGSHPSILLQPNCAFRKIHFLSKKFMMEVNLVIFHQFH